METVALCNTCLKKIPASYQVADVVELHKVCPEHGEQSVIVENDPTFFVKFNHPANKIFDAYFIDITDICNLNCSYCYHPSGNSDKPFAEIVAEANSQKLPVYLTGGEPTLREDLPELVEEIKNPVYMPTNGIGLRGDYLHRLFKVIAHDDGYAGIALSYHFEYPGLFHEAMEEIINGGYRITSVIFTITDAEQMRECQEIADKYAQYVLCFRVHCAANIWNAKVNIAPFLSEVVKRFGGKVIPELSKIIWVVGIRDGKVWGMCRWDTVETIDINNTSCSPVIKANDGNLYHLTEGFIRNGKAD